MVEAVGYRLLAAWPSGVFPGGFQYLTLSRLQARAFMRFTRSGLIDAMLQLMLAGVFAAIAGS